MLRNRIDHLMIQHVLEAIVWYLRRARELGSVNAFDAILIVA